jgi:hypothetical protein
MTGNPWQPGGPDPQPGDFDEDLERLGHEDVQYLEGNPDAQVSIQLIVRGDDADALTRLAANRGQSVDRVVAELIRGAAPVRR